MGNRISMAAASLAAAVAAAGGAGAAELQVSIEDIRSEEGTVLVQIVRGELGFEGEEPALAQISMRPTGNAVRFGLELPAGTYGIRVFHDVDDSAELETTLVGMPSEPWAFSNNAVGTFGPPGWDAVSFELGESPAVQSIRLNH